MLCRIVAHELVVEVHVVLAEQLPAQRLLVLRQVVQVGARVRAQVGQAQAGSRALGELVDAAAQLR